MQLTESNKLEYIIYKLNAAHEELKQSSVKKKGILKTVHKEAARMYKSRQDEILKLNLQRIEKFDFKIYLSQCYKVFIEKLNKEKDEKVKKYLQSLN